MNNTTNVGFIIINLTENTDKKILHTIKEIETNNVFGSTIIFSSNNNMVNSIDLPVLHLSQAQFFKGTLFLFDMPSIILTNNFKTLNKRILCSNSTPWTKGPNTHYKEWKSLFGNESLQILSGSQEHYDVMSICWKQPIGIMENFDYENIKQYI
jgi:hypothetical protein